MTATKAKTKRNKAQKTDSIRIKIREQVIALLGKPKDLWRVDVFLYNAGVIGRARVNIWQREMVRAEKKGGFMGAMSKPELIEQTHITDSYYLWLSKTAIIESANPPINRRY